MSTMQAAEDLLKEGRLAESLGQLQEHVRADPSDVKARIFLFQLLAVMGQWDRAMTQLNVAADMDAAALMMANVCRPALNCEVLRREIFEGQRSPLIFGEPDEWIGSLVQACQLGAQGHHAESDELRGRAFEAAPAVGGTINGEPFEWLADADPRLGPVLEAIIDGRYYWVPLVRIQTLVIEEPTDLRDVVWLPASFVWTHQGESFGLIPTRYPGTEEIEDDSLRLARRTEWTEVTDTMCHGVGQRLLATDQSEYALLEVREISFAHKGADTGNAGSESQTGDQPSTAGA